MLSISHKFLFIHIPKTGGTSVQSVLAPYSEDTIVRRVGVEGEERPSFGVENPRYRAKKHSPLSHYWAHMRANGEMQLFGELRKFAIIRNPWDRCVSWYFSPHRGVRRAWSREDFLRLLPQIHHIGHYTTLPTLQDRLAAKVGLKGKLPALQRHRLDRDMDRLLRFESLSADFDEVLRELGLPGAELPHQNSSRREDYRQYYDQELRDLVAHKYFEEIRYGRYEF